VEKIKKLKEEIKIAWGAFDQAEEELQKLREEIKRLKLQIKKEDL
jgi:peptidoglycan hydrolase CwlO-like protein